MKLLGQTLSTIGLLAIAAVIVLVANGVAGGQMAWGRIALALVVAAGFFVAAGLIGKRGG